VPWQRSPTSALARSEIQRLSRSAGTSLGLVPERLQGLDSVAGCLPAETPRLLSDNGLMVLGWIGGAFCAAVLAGQFRPRGARLRTLGLAAGGGVLLGFGAMISLGCTIGTLLSGVMAFAVSGWVFGAGLAAGAVIASLALRRWPEALATPCT
jgi:hypothetical protein